MKSEVFTTSQVVEFLGVPMSTFSNWRYRSDFPKPLGKRKRAGELSYNADEIREWFANQPIDRRDHMAFEDPLIEVRASELNPMLQLVGLVTAALKANAIDSIIYRDKMHEVLRRYGNAAEREQMRWIGSDTQKDRLGAV